MKTDKNKTYSTKSLFIYVNSKLTQVWVLTILSIWDTKSDPCPNTGHVYNQSMTGLWAEISSSLLYLIGH